MTREQNRRPLIGVTPRLIQERESETLATLGVRRTYFDAITAAGGFPVLLPISPVELVSAASLPPLAGLLIPGGEDVAPERYQESPHPKLGVTAPERDAWEIAIIRWAYAAHLPILGICRGLQVMNVALGGSLIQDIPSQAPSPTNHCVMEWFHQAHVVNLTAHSRLATILGTATITANSIHHQAIDRLAPPLRVAGVAPDGIIEAVEAADHPFCFGVQCHPETLWHEVEPRWASLFAAFIQAAQDQTASKR